MTGTPPPDEVHWTEAGSNRHAHWRSEAGLPPPRRVQVADDTLPADAAYRLVCEGTALLWRGDFHNARQLLQALARRIDRRTERNPERRPSAQAAFPAAFHQHRKAQVERARLLGALLLPFDADHGLPLRRAPDVRLAALHAYGPAAAPYVASLRSLLGVIGAYEWHQRGVPVPALGARIHPHYGVFAPVRDEYVDLVQRAAFPAALNAQLSAIQTAAQTDPPASAAFDIGTGTGVLAAVLARRGVAPITATDNAPRALACARDNLARLQLTDQVSLQQSDLFPPGRAALVVCNPPWVPARPSSPLEHAVYDPDSRMLRGFLDGLGAHLVPGGEGWLILSDLAEHLGLRSRAELLGWIADAGLAVAGRDEIRPRHPRATPQAGRNDDPLQAARAAERTSLWRLVVAERPPPLPQALPLPGLEATATG